MTESKKEFNATDAAIRLLNDYRRKQQRFDVFSEYDAAMEHMRETASASIGHLKEPLKSVASRLFQVTDKGFFLFHVCFWKIDLIAEALIHSIDAKNPIALANNARALVEHLAALVAIAKELEKLENRLSGQGQEKQIHEALEKAETFIYRAYHGKSPKTTSEPHEQALHVNDCIKVLQKEVPDIEEVYDFLCDFVHPNYGSNALVSMGVLGSGRLNPPEEFHQEVLDRIRRYCSLCMIFINERSDQYGSVLLKLQGLVNRCFTRGATVNTAFGRRRPSPEGDGKSKETAYFFRKALTAPEATEMAYMFLKDKGCDVQGTHLVGFGDGVFFDLYDTDEGQIWFKVPAKLN